ncbi:hypothetical protein [Nocardia sp. NPDC050793]|uniref:hypothetical protein n=1 Tax=Nocardia sp. NPDC050793 TaxID=3155159 RepID=UPI0033CD1B4E
MLLAERHLASHQDFCAAYKQCAAQLGAPHAKDDPPSKAQFYNWMSGEKMVGLPHNHHRRVLAHMFPGWSVKALFSLANAPGVASQAPDEPAVIDQCLAAFFGSEMIDRGATLVVPTFELATRSVEVLEAAGIPRQHIFSKRASVFNAQHRIDVPTALAENDVRGMLYVMSMMQRHDGMTVEIQSDREVVLACDRPYISFGLSSNDCTHMYLESTNTPLFTIQDTAPSHGPYLEHLVLADGHRYSSDDSRNIGIIARVRPSADLHPDRYWILCAGLGSRGTTGASWYLAKHWRTLQERAIDREFVAVISVRTYSDQTAYLEHLLIN